MQGRNPVLIKQSCHQVGGSFCFVKQQLRVINSESSYEIVVLIASLVPYISPSLTEQEFRG